MATLSWGPTTSATNLDKVWRIVQLQLAKAFNFVVEEWDILESRVPRMRINLSARQIILPLDINEDYGVASIPEGGWEALPASPNVVDSEFTWITLHKRFSLTRTARHLDRGGNSEAQVMKQIRYQGMKAVQAIHRRIGDYFWGYSSATMFKVTSISTNTVTVKDLYGEAGLGASAYNAHLKRIVKAGDRLAIINPTGPALRGTGVVASVHATNATFDFTSAPGGTAANDLIKFANSVEDADLVQTDHNRGLTGMLDALKSASVQNVSNSTVPNWDVGYADTAAGRFGTVELRRGKQGIMNRGGGDANLVFMSQGVSNDLVAGLRGGLRFSNAFALEVDGEPTAKGMKIMSTQRVPPGHVVMLDKANSVKKINLLDGLQTPGWQEAEKIPNRAGFVFPIDWPCQMVYTSRANMAYFTNKTEQ